MELQLPCLERCKGYDLVSSNSDEELADSVFKSSFRRQASVDFMAGIPGIGEIRSAGGRHLHQHVWETSVQHTNEQVERELDCCITFGGIGTSGTDQNPNIIRFGSKLERLVFWGMRVLSLLDLLYVPFVVSFDYVYPLRRGIVRPLMDLVLTSCYAFGVALRLQTSIVRHEDVEEVTRLPVIRATVLRSGAFRMDLVALLATPFLYVQPPMGLLCIFRLLKCYRLRPDPQRRMLLNSERMLLVQIFEILCAMFICIHLYACAWFTAKVCSPLSVGREWSAWNGWSRDVFEKPNADFSALSIPIEPGDISDLMYCWARAARDGVYMVTSWGGPNALSLTELSVIIVLGPMSGIIMAYVYAIFVTTITRMVQFEVKFHERSAILAACCRQMHLPEDLCFRINRYYSYVALHHHDHNTQELFSELSSNLMNEARLFRMRDIVCESELFQQLTSSLVLPLLAGCCESVFSPGDIVVRKGELADCVYIIMRGSASVLPDMDSQTPVAMLRERQMFGEICFYTGKNPRTAWVRSESFAVISHLDKDHFDMVLAGHPTVKQRVLDAIIHKVRNYRRETISMLSDDLVAQIQTVCNEIPFVREDSPATGVGESSEAKLARTKHLLEEVGKHKSEGEATKSDSDDDYCEDPSASHHGSKEMASLSASRRGSRETVPAVLQSSPLDTNKEVRLLVRSEAAQRHACSTAASAAAAAAAATPVAVSTAPSGICAHFPEHHEKASGQCSEVLSDQPGTGGTTPWAVHIEPLQIGLQLQERATASLQGQVSEIVFQLRRIEQTQQQIASALGVIATHRQPTSQLPTLEGSGPVQAPGG